MYYTQQKVIERATGRRNAEEWTFLPDNWTNTVDRFQIIFSENFLYLRFEKPGDNLLFMNLISRKQFWMRESVLLDHVKSKMDGVNVDEVPIRELTFHDMAINSMNAKTEAIEIGLVTYHGYVEIGES